MNITDVLALVVFLTTWGVIEVMFWKARRYKLAMGGEYNA